MGQSRELLEARARSAHPMHVINSSRPTRLPRDNVPSSRVFGTLEPPALPPALALPLVAVTPSLSPLRGGSGRLWRTSFISIVLVVGVCLFPRQMGV